MNQSIVKMPILVCVLLSILLGSAHGADSSGAWEAFASWGTGMNRVQWSEEYLDHEIKGGSTFQLGLGRTFSLGDWALGAVNGSWFHVSGEYSSSDNDPLDPYSPFSLTIDETDEHFLLQGALLFRVGRNTAKRWVLGPTIGTVTGTDGIVKSGGVTFGARGLVTFADQDGSWSTGLDMLFVEGYPIDDRLSFISLFVSKSF